MTSLSVFSEPFARTGNIAAEGFRKLLGRPEIGLIQMLIREALQNCMDASLDGTGPEVEVRVRTLSDAERSCLAKEVLGELPNGDDSRTDIARSLEKDVLRVIEICDFGTHGMSGTTRADIAPDDREPSNFVNFMRNVGAGRDTTQGGGTYGYGKAALYGMSSCSTIVVDSETSCRGIPVRRLMGSHLGSAYAAAGTGGNLRRFTGRHWWGISEGEDTIEPITGAAAESLSNRLGMPFRDRRRTGSTIMILDPLISDELTDEAVGADLVDAILWNFWPRMTMDTPANRRLNARVEVSNSLVAIPLPEDYAPLDLFARALAKVRAKADCTQVERARPKRLLGYASIEKGFRGNRNRPKPTTTEHEAIYQQACHIALMRPVELVVTYLRGEPFMDSTFEWAGVFMCSEDVEVEGAFAASEPPAHDAWEPTALTGEAKSFVTLAKKRLRELASEVVSGKPVSPKGVEAGPSMARVAARLGRLLDEVSAKGPGRSSTGRSPARPKGSIWLSPASFTGLSSIEGRPVAKFSATLINDGSDSRLTLDVATRLVTTSGRTDFNDLPGDYEAQILGVNLNGQTLAGDTGRYAIARDEGTFEIIIACPKEAAIGVELKLIAGDEA